MEQDDYLRLEMEVQVILQCQKLYHSSFPVAKDLEVCFDLINSITQPIAFIIKEIYSLWRLSYLQFYQVQAKEYEIS